MAKENYIVIIVILMTIIITIIITGKWGEGVGGRGGGGVRPRVKNPKSPNGTETDQLPTYKRGRGFSRVIQILIR